MKYGCTAIGVTLTECVCHTQNGAPRGYGFIRYQGKPRRYHRVVYCQYHGVSIESIDGLIVRHKCDNTRCINPEHLEIGTQKDNMRDMRERKRERKPKGEQNGSSTLTDELVIKLRSEYLPGVKGHGATVLARKYGLARSTVERCLYRKSWSHI